MAVPPDPQLMAQIAELSGGRSFNAHSADQLGSIYKRLGNELGTVTRKREVTAEFVIGGIVLLLLAAVGSTRWSARLP
jgi:Ca-activated chloride channel family protein